MKEIKCPTGCCNITLTTYIRKKIQRFFDKKDKPKKAGIFITNKTQDKILLVQSKEQFWGPPKGSLNKEETIEEGAIREVLEETGINFETGKIGDVKFLKGKSYYYFQQIDEYELQVQTHIENNDANGIGWFTISCLEDFIKKGTIKINQHCRLLIKNLLNKTLSQNQTDKVFKLKFITI